MEKKSVTITIEKEFVGQMADITKSLQDEGLDIDLELEFGVVIGKANDEMIEKMRKRKEIEAVNFESKIQLPPPDSDIQ